MWSRVRVLELVSGIRETMDSYETLTDPAEVHELVETVVLKLCDAIEELVRPGSSVPDEEPPEEK